MSNTLRRGLSEAYGSWNTICTRRRQGLSAFSESGAMSVPSNTMRPAAGFTRRSSVRDSVDFPQPDSPTRPTVSPARMSNDTPSTACSTPPTARG
jgi:hypothetical protein